MTASVETANRPELIVALVGPVGTRLDQLSAALRDELATFGYEAVDIRLSDLLVNFSGWTNQEGPSESDRIRHLQKMGNALRRNLADGAALARAGIAAIRVERASRSGSPDHPVSALAYVIHQLKHPAEVELLRQVYGSSCLLVAGHAPRDMRIETLTERMARQEFQTGQEHRYKSKASEIVSIDEKEDDAYGQNTRDVYPLADFFANMGVPSGERDVERFIDLVFGHPYRTPTPDEYAMYQASAVSLRSSDDNRQVGAVIVSLTRDRGDRIRNADIIAVGMNEVPRGGGGFYWDSDSPDCRDQKLLEQGSDRAAEIKIGVLAELIGRIRDKEWFRKDLAETTPALALLLLQDMKGTQFMDIGEFGRPVHAEMAALIDSARRGVAVNGHTMYVTTFPCHNCAKHIIAAGLRRVVYLEPYPKSRASSLHKEEVVLDPPGGKEEEGKVVFSAFSGIAPRKYRELFSISERGAKKGNSLKRWQELRRSLSPRYVTPNAAAGYLIGERQELEKLANNQYRWDRNAVCPDIKN